MMEVNTLVSSNQVKNMDMDCGFHVMEVSMKAIGLKVKEMVWVYL
jgi:hypothetical protein